MFVRCLLFLHGIASEAAAEFLEDLTVYLAEHDCGVNLTVAQFGQLLQSETAVLIVLGEYGEGHQHLVGMQAGVLGT